METKNTCAPNKPSTYQMLFLFFIMRKITLSRNIFQSRIKTSELPIKCLILVTILQTKIILCHWMLSHPLMGIAEDLFNKQKKQQSVLKIHLS